MGQKRQFCAGGVAAGYRFAAGYRTAILLMLLAAVGCVPNDVPPIPINYLQHFPAITELSPSQSADTARLKLLTECATKLHYVKGWGDTARFTHSFIGQSSDSTILHRVLFTAHPVAGDSRLLNASFVFSAPRWPDLVYLDTLTVVYTP